MPVYCEKGLTRQKRAAYHISPAPGYAHIPEPSFFLNALPALKPSPNQLQIP